MELLRQGPGSLCALRVYKVSFVMFVIVTKAVSVLEPELDQQPTILLSQFSRSAMDSHNKCI